MNSINDKNCSNSRMLEDTQCIGFCMDSTMQNKHARISSEHEDSILEINFDVLPIASPTCTTMSGTFLDDLPDVCLLAVFKYIPLIELLRNIRWVNTRWSLLVPTELNLRHSLVIVDDRTFNQLDLQLDKHQSHLIQLVSLDDHYGLMQLPPIDDMNLVDRTSRYSDNNPLHNQVQPEMITTLVDNLPRIHSLTVVQRFFDLSALDQIVRMIVHWRGELVSLKLYLNHELFIYSRYKFNQINDRILPSSHKAQLKARTLALFDSINRATSLKHLKVNLDNFNLETPFTRPPLKILSQLNTFDLNAFNDHLGSELVRNASTNRDLEISTNFSLKFLLGINSEFCDRFVDVKLEGNRRLNVENMNRFCTRFTSLVHLYINNQHHIPVTRLAQCLSSLTQLVHLRMRLCARRLDDDLLAEKKELPPDQIVSVPSVRLLTIHLFIRSHNATRQFHLHQVFPNVEVLSIESNTLGCSDCGFDYSRMRQSDEMRGQMRENAPRLRQCAQLARRPFRRCPRLHTLHIDANDLAFLTPSNEKILITRDDL